MSNKQYERPVLNSEKMFEKTVLSCIKGEVASKSNPCSSSPKSS